jgi:hypothetical protein
MEGGLVVRQGKNVDDSSLLLLFDFESRSTTCYLSNYCSDDVGHMISEGIKKAEKIENLEHFLG